MTQLDAFPEAVLHPEEDPDERYTPWTFFIPLDQEFNFTVDACATQESRKAPVFWTKEQNGLAQSWKGARVWCNPPYSDIRPWVEKAWQAEAELVVMLVPAWTDRQWWHELVEPFRDRDGIYFAPFKPAGDPFSRCATLSTRFVPGRVKFGFPGNPNGVGIDQPPFWSCLLIWRSA